MNPTVKLTPKEEQIAKLLCEGLSRKMVAGRMKVTESTIETHINNLYQKLGIHDRISLCRWWVSRPDREEINATRSTIVQLNSSWWIMCNAHGRPTHAVPAVRMDMIIQPLKDVAP